MHIHQAQNLYLIAEGANQPTQSQKKIWFFMYMNKLTCQWVKKIVLYSLTLAKIMELLHFEDVQLDFLNLTENKRITVKTENISGFIK